MNIERRINLFKYMGILFTIVLLISGLLYTIYKYRVPTIGLVVFMVLHLWILGSYTAHSNEDYTQKQQSLWYKQEEILKMYTEWLGKLPTLPLIWYWLIAMAMSPITYIVYIVAQLVFTYHVLKRDIKKAQTVFKEPT